MNRLLGKIFILLLSTVYLNADSMFLLTKINKAYLVVENYSTKLPMSIKEGIYEELKNATDELKIDTSGYGHRTFGVMLYDTMLDGKLILNIELILGEEVKRVDDGEAVYALTYEKRKQFILTNKSADDIEEELEDNINLLLTDFTEQYIEDNE